MVDYKQKKWKPLLDATKVAELEKALEDDPEDLDARNELLQHYMMEALTCDDYVPLHLKHLVWLIENHPDSAILRTSSCRLKSNEDRTDCKIVAALWMQQAEKYPNSQAVLGNAAFNLMTAINSRSHWAQARKWLLKAEKLEPHNPKWKSLLGDYHRHLSWGKRDDKAREASLLRALRYYREEYDLTDKDVDKALLLPTMAQCAFETRDYTAAEHYAQSLLEAAPMFDNRDWRWNYGNAVHWGHIYLGKIAIRSGDKNAALDHLKEAGKIHGSPQLNSFGPDFTLAHGLLQLREQEAVLDYLKACGTFWHFGTKELAAWTEAVKQGDIPDFEPVY